MVFLTPVTQTQGRRPCDHTGSDWSDASVNRAVWRVATATRSYWSLQRECGPTNTLALYFYFFKFLAALGLCCCTRAFSSCGEWGLLFVAVCELLIAVASRCGARVLGSRASVVAARRLSSCGSRALERRLSSCGTRA